MIERIDSVDGNVCKFVYRWDTAVAESVLYKYPTYQDRTVICCSTQSGCPVGCRFCGAGDYFVRNLTTKEIILQVDHSIEQTGIPADDMQKLQIMFMSMGEPMLTQNRLCEAIRELHKNYPHASLLVSTIGPDVGYTRFMEVSKEVPTVGLQFSVHESSDAARNALIPFENKLSLYKIARLGGEWHRETGRKPFFNYCAADHNTSSEDVSNLVSYFNPLVWECTISVICERNEGIPSRNDHQIKLASDFSERMLEAGYNVRVFDPAGQDDIGGGCGQLWFVQKWMKDNPSKARPSIGYGLPIIEVPK